MLFDTFTPRMKIVAESSLEFCKERFCRRGLKIEERIVYDIEWIPTLYLKDRTKIIAVEVAENLYPQILKEIIPDILDHPFPIFVFQACPLEVYQSDYKERKIKELKNHGFGIITVDDNGIADQKSSCIPLQQHISFKKLHTEIKELSSRLKQLFFDAHNTYQTHAIQGLQQASKIIEDMINVIIRASSANKSEAINIINNHPLAYRIDKLYDMPRFHRHRASLGGTRDFINQYRNLSSHTPRNAKERAEQLNKCRSGFLDSINIANQLQKVMRYEKIKMLLIL